MDQDQHKVLAYYKGEESYHAFFAFAVKQCGGDEHAAKDLLSKVFANLYGYVKNRKVENFDGLVITCIKNARDDEYRKSQTRANAKIDVREKYYSGSYELDEFYQRKMIEDRETYIFEHIEELIPDEVDRFVFIRFHIDAVPYEKIGEELREKRFEGSTESNTLAKRNERTRKKLAEKIMELFPELRGKYIHKKTNL